MSSNLFAVRFGLLNSGTVLEIQTIGDIYMNQDSPEGLNEIKFDFECNPEDQDHLKDLLYMEGYLHFIDKENEEVNKIPPLKGHFTYFQFIQTSYDWLRKAEAIFIGSYTYIKDKAKVANDIYTKKENKSVNQSRVKRTIKRKISFT